MRHHIVRIHGDRICVPEMREARLGSLDGRATQYAARFQKTFLSGVAVAFGEGLVEVVAISG